MKTISIGAEAVIYLKGDTVIKERIRKSYRHKSIDEKLRKERTNREARNMEKASRSGVPVPKIGETKEYKINMEFIDGTPLRDYLSSRNCKKICHNVGVLLARLHNSNIIHGDLTTSNLIIKKGKIYFIDFGLSTFSKKIEDKATDIHLFCQALNSSHAKFADNAYSSFFSGYKKESNSHKEIKNRLEKIESRGRYK